MNSLERISRIDRSQLSGAHFVSSLLEQAYHTEVLTTAQIEAIQLACLSVLARQTQLYNGLDSSSVRVEEAEGIMESILFTIGIALKEYENPDDAAQALLSDGAEALFLRGSKKIDRLLKTTKLIHVSLLRRLFVTPNVFYRSTLEDGINGFFKLYRPQFSAQQIHITADYPLLQPVEDLVGIELIREYLERADSENQFCACFNPAAVDALFCGLPIDYRELPVNLCGPVLTAAISCALSGKNFYTLSVTQQDLLFLRDKLIRMPKEEILQLFEAVFHKICEALSLPERTKEYLTAALPGITVEVENAVRNNTMSSIFYIARIRQGGKRS